jgi:uncharacterized protein
MAEPVTVEIELSGERATTSARCYGERGAPTLVLAHGAGAAQDHPRLVAHATALAAAGLEVVTFNFLYTDNGRRVPDRMPILEATYRGVLGWLRARGVGRLVIGGKSMGGRVASMIAAAMPGMADALVFLGYPLHPPKRPEQLRAAHLARIAEPMLFVQGERDPFGTPDELGPILAGLPRATLHVVPGGDHALCVPRRLRPQVEADGETHAAIAGFVRG